MLDINIIKARIAARAEDFLRELFGERLHRAGPNAWRVGRNGSLALDTRKSELLFHSFENETDCGDCIALWQRERGGDFSSALRACAAWAGVADDGTLPVLAPRTPKPAMSATDKLGTRPQGWPMLDPTHDVLWRLGVERLIRDAGAREEIARWRGWQRDVLVPLARAHLISAPVFDLWPGAITPQPCVAFRVLQPERVTDGEAAFWALRPVQLHVRFRRGATRCDGSGLSWVYAPTMKQLAVSGGGNAPLLITRDGRDPEQPGYGTRCRCAIICAGEWDALSVLLAAWWIDDFGTLTVPPGLAIVGIRGEGRSGTDAFLRYFSHWHLDSAVLLADADRTGMAWFHPSPDGRAGFAEQLEQRGVKVIARAPREADGIKDVNDLYRTGRFGLPDVEEMLTAAGFDWKGGVR